MAKPTLGRPSPPSGSGVGSSSRSRSRSRSRSYSGSDSRSSSRSRSVSSHSRSRSRSFSSSSSLSRSLSSGSGSPPPKKKRKASPIRESLVLHIDSLSRNVNEGHLKEIFSNFGEVVHVELAMDRTVLILVFSSLFKGVLRLSIARGEIPRT